MTVEDYLSLSMILTQEDLESVINILEPFNENDKFSLDWHNKLDHLPAQTMLTLSDNGKKSTRISKIFRTRRLPVCASCLFGQVHRKP